jgi:2-amino-4-hydroxy-6-hydroxymethyldihydropteridine diphosphokinase
MPVCFIGLGSNLGDRLTNINLAVAKIRQLKETKVTKMSSVIETPPVGGPPQAKYLNAAVEISTSLGPRELLTSLQNIESGLGRIRTIKNASRTIDLDILLYDDLVINEPGLILPHPRMREREFVLTPLKEIAPGVTKRFINENNQKD